MDACRCRFISEEGTRSTLASTNNCENGVQQRNKIDKNWMTGNAAGQRQSAFKSPSTFMKRKKVLVFECMLSHLCVMLVNAICVCVVRIVSYRARETHIYVVYWILLCYELTGMLFGSDQLRKRASDGMRNVPNVTHRIPSGSLRSCGNNCSHKRTFGTPVCPITWHLI